MEEARIPDRDDGGENWAQLYARHAEQWSLRFAEALRASELDGVVIFSGVSPLRWRDDIEYPFFPEPYFKAWVPAVYPRSALRIVPGETHRLVYFRGADCWHVPASAPEGFWTPYFDIRRADSTRALLKELDIAPRLAAIGACADETMGFAAVNPPSLLEHLDFYRAFKTPYEVACIAEANRIAARGHAAARDALSATPSEFSLNQTYCAATGQREPELPYPNIVALNEHAGVLHYQHLDRTAPAALHSFLLDAGADFNGYAADVSRTYARGGGRFAELIDAMDAMQRRLCAEARNGVDFVSLHEQAHRLLAEVLEAHEITRCKADESYDRGITRSFLPHGLGHLLGLQVHDAGGHLRAPGAAAGSPPREHPALRLTRTLEPGFVVTVEPGLYFIPSLLDELGAGPLNGSIDWEALDELLPCGGIRIEDNVAVTQGQSRNLSRPALLQSGIA